jgi:hypothetical protein
MPSPPSADKLRRGMIHYELSPLVFARGDNFSLLRCILVIQRNTNPGHHQWKNHDTDFTSVAVWCAI